MAAFSRLLVDIDDAETEQQKATWDSVFSFAGAEGCTDTAQGAPSENGQEVQAQAATAAPPDSPGEGAVPPESSDSAPGVPDGEPAPQERRQSSDYVLDAQTIEDSQKVWERGREAREARGAEWDNLWSEYLPLKPRDDTQLGEAELLAGIYSGRIAYSCGQGWMVYDDTRWKPDRLAVERLEQNLLWAQKDAVSGLYFGALQEYAEATEHFDKETADKWKKRVQAVQPFQKLVQKLSTASQLKGVLEMAQSICAVDDSALDRDAELLNAPGGAVNLRTGEMLPHNPDDWITKCTAVSPGDEGQDLFLRFLNELTGGDLELQEYLQQVAGMCCIGKVYEEKFLLCYGPGGNGKSTFWGALKAVLGDYGKAFPSELITKNCPGNSRNLLFELRGVRLAVAGELDENSVLDIGNLKHLCSADDIVGEQKYHQPVTFRPSHTAILFCNHLPNTRNTDLALWDRIRLIPMTQRFRDTQQEIKNFKDVLVEKSGPAILQWMVTGAQKFIEAGHVLPACEAIERATELYRQQSDTLGEFLSIECIEDPDAFTPGAALYTRYRMFLQDCGEPVPTRRQMTGELKRRGYLPVRNRDSRGFRGLSLRIS